VISVSQARKLIARHAKTIGPETLPLEKALGRALARPMRAPHPFPLFDVSAMDGYAVRAADFRKLEVGSRKCEVKLKVIGTIKAGDAPTLKLKPGCAIRIMTGAAIPLGADAVVPKEMVSFRLPTSAFRLGQAAISVEADVRRGDHIREGGEEIARGALAAPAGTLLNSRWIGFLRNLGVSKVGVGRSPVVSVVVTGSELLKPGQAPRPGKIFDSNLPMLQAALGETGFQTRVALTVPDSPSALRNALKQALASSDVCLLVGGVSVGDYDYSRPVLKELGVRQIFWGVAQKPGKPLYFGGKSGKLVFGLPGNPASVLVCFHEYVLPALRLLEGMPAGPDALHARLLKPAKADKSKTLFLKAQLQPGRGVLLLGGQQSHMLQALAQADCLAIIPPGRNLPRGAEVEVHPL
jgi:molybdopterin molybdotransferase